DPRAVRGRTQYLRRGGPGLLQRPVPRRLNPVRPSGRAISSRSETHMTILDRFRVEDQVAIVTGAGRGIGAASAIALAEAGADVVVSARTEEQVRETA